MDELNEYLECTCGHCDDGISRCCEWEDDQSQEIICDNLDCEEDVEVNND